VLAYQSETIYFIAILPLPNRLADGDILSDMDASAKLFGTTALTDTRAETIKQTYILLGLSVGAAGCGGYLGAQSDTLASTCDCRRHRDLWGVHSRLCYRRF
jgi:hypothetical protein